MYIKKIFQYAEKNYKVLKAFCATSSLTFLCETRKLNILKYYVKRQQSQTALKLSIAQNISKLIKKLMQVDQNRQSANLS